ncbi:hypothetical protein PYW08_010946 [Mythimna loreyi]|uniref:Uncharacterized protein n=1 Tax=Mythimna loreyi TaxID=667449 RepID=A0ACC2Q2R6_9NEOP|nr:hypothetical protein PYW08_010946 [Mythimna loreyi]
MGDLKSHIKQLSDHLSQCYGRLDEYDARIKTLEKREEEIITLNSTIVNLCEQLNAQAQSSIRNELEISGVNEFKNENPHHIIQVMAHKFGVTVEDHDIDFATRVGSRRQASKVTAEIPTRPLVIRFVRRCKRDEFLKAAKARKTMSSSDMEIDGPSRNVYFNERLTQENRQLFRAAKLASKQQGYRFCWHKNGAILIRKQEGNPPIHVRNFEDLEFHLGPTTMELHQSSPSAELRD